MKADVDPSSSPVEADYTTVSAHGYVVLKGVYRRDDIQRIADAFDTKFQENIRQGKVQSRDYRRFACKLPISAEYEPILNNPRVHRLMARLLGDEYVLFAFSSHSSLPGSSHQEMHVDWYDLLNTPTFVVKEADIAFLHIPLIDMAEEHGATELWPITLYTKPGTHQASSGIMRWVKYKTQRSTENLEQGDVVIKLGNTVHAGGANKSRIRRHIVTLIFARKHTYLTYNTGGIPCGSYQWPGMPRFPYRISAHATLESVSSTSTYVKEGMGETLQIPSGLAAEIQFNQYAYIKKAVSKEILDRIAAGPSEFIKNASWTLNLVEHVLPAVRAAFRGAMFKLHSVALSDSTRKADCDDPTFRNYLGEHVFNNADKLIRVHVPLEDAGEWIRAYPGNKTLSMNILRGISEALGLETFDRYRRDLASVRGGALITTGALVYSRATRVPTLDLTFAREGYIPSYDDRYRVTDVFALSLPKELGYVLRYDDIFITQPQYKEFTFNRPDYVRYVVLNYFSNMAVDHPLRAKGLFVLLGPIVLCALGVLHLLRRGKHPVSSMLSSA